MKAPYALYIFMYLTTHELYNMYTLYTPKIPHLSIKAPYALYILMYLITHELYNP